MFLMIVNDEYTDYQAFMDIFRNLNSYSEVNLPMYDLPFQRMYSMKTAELMGSK
jgi:hypothetical protein